MALDPDTIEALDRHFWEVTGSPPLWGYECGNCGGPLAYVGRGHRWVCPCNNLGHAFDHDVRRAFVVECVRCGWADLCFPEKPQRHPGMYREYQGAWIQPHLSNWWDIPDDS